MSVVLLRKLLNVLLILTLAVPAAGFRQCCCARATASAKSAAKAASALPPCCAKRLAAQTAPESSPTVKPKCCCGDILWSQTAAKIIPARVDDSRYGYDMTLVICPDQTLVSAPVLPICAESGIPRAVPPDISCVRLCRWLA